MANFLIFKDETQLAPFKNYHLARIDGSQATQLKGFFEQIEKALLLPDFEHDLDLLDALLNDLSWIKKKEVALVISNTSQWLSQEKKATKRLDLLAMLDATAEDWKWLDEGDETPPKNFKILLEHDPKLLQLLDKENFEYKSL